MRGGAFIDEGSVGCTFFSPIKCADGTDLPGKLGKVFDYDKDALHEQYNNRIVESLDPDRLFTVKMYKLCNVSKYRETDKSHLCSFIGNSATQRKQLIYEYGGYDFDTLPHTVPLARIVTGFEGIMFGLVALQVHAFAHLDISIKNVLFDNALGKAYLIDFGWLTPCKKVYKPYYRDYYGHRYPWYPPEFKIAAILVENDVFDVTFDSFRDYFATNFGRTLSFKAHCDRHPGALQGLRDLYDHVRGTLRGDKAKAFRFLATAADKVDVYSAGMVLQHILLKYDGKAHPALRDLVGRMTSFDPRARPDAVAAYALYVKVMRRVGVKPAFSKRATVVRAAELLRVRLLPVTRLRAMCASMHLPKTGSKDDLLARIINAKPT